VASYLQLKWLKQPSLGEERSAPKLLAEGKRITRLKLVLHDTSSKWHRLQKPTGNRWAFYKQLQAPQQNVWDKVVVL